MSRIVAVHGIGHQFVAEHTICDEWLLKLRDGLSLVDREFPNASDLACASWGDLFRPEGKGGVDLPYDWTDVEEGWEQNLLELWWREAAKVDPENVPGPELEGKGRTPRFVQRALDALSNAKFFAGAFQWALVGDLKQVRDYLHNDAIRSKVQQRVEQKVGEDTRLIIGHSLGSVIAYEALCAHPDWPIRTFVTLGSPLGIRNLVFDLLRPPPVSGVGVWPGSVERWTNIADGGDIVALKKKLGPLFGGGTCNVEDHLIYNGARAHSVAPYLTAKETGGAIAAGLYG